MDAEQLSVLITKFAAEVPPPVGESLDGVDILVYETVDHANDKGQGLPAEFDDPIDPVPADCKGVFIGEPLEADDDSDEADMPEGVIALIAGNIATPEEGIVVLTHEIGHALGLDEQGVKDLGLATPAPAPEPQPQVQP